MAYPQQPSHEHVRELTMHIEFLGRMRIRRRGQEINISAAKQRVVLATLAVNAGSHVPMELLVDELWADQPPTTAVRTIQTYVYQIRRALDLAEDPAHPDSKQAALITSSRGYVLRLGEHSTVDTVLFRSLIRRGRAHLEHGEYDEAATDLRTALNLWSGSAFGDVPTGPTLGARLISLEHVRTSAREMLFEAELHRGRHNQIVHELGALTHTDPTQERFAALLMTALYRGGHRAEALRTFHTLRAALDARLGVAPSATVQNVLQRILADRGIGVDIAVIG
jgi:DNA-binding SARP family transcriptional activator